MSTFINGKSFTVNLDADQLLDVPTDTPDFQKLLQITNVSRALSETIDTFFTLENEGFSNNQVTALDTQYDLTIKGDKDDTLIQSLISCEWDIAKRNRNVMQIIDDFTGKTIEVNSPVTAISDTREIETIVEFAVSMKFNGKPTIT